MFALDKFMTTIDESKTNWHWLCRFIRSVAKVFAPLM